MWVKYKDTATKIRNLQRSSDVDDLIDAAYNSPHFGGMSGQVLAYYRGRQLKRSTKLETIDDIDNTTEQDPVLLDSVLLDSVLLGENGSSQQGMYLCYWRC